MTRIEPVKPNARKEDLIVRELTDEVLVYDLNRDKAHCLNETAALVWKLCDGQTTVAEMSRVMRGQLRTPVDERVIWLALDQLERSHLLQSSVKRPTRKRRMPRREMMRKLGWAAASLPVVVSIVAPLAVQAATCRVVGQCCKPGSMDKSLDCCPGLQCTGADCTTPEGNIAPKTCR